MKDCVIGEFHGRCVGGCVPICLLGRCLAERRRCHVTARSSIAKNDHRVTVKVSSRESQEIGTGEACRNLGVCCILQVPNV